MTNNNIYVLIAVIIIVIVSNIIIYNIGMKNGKRICLESIKNKRLESIEKAKAKGKYTGRKPKDLPENYEDIINKWKNKEITTMQATKELNIGKTTLYRRFKRD